MSTPPPPSTGQDLLNAVVEATARAAAPRKQADEDSAARRAAVQGSHERGAAPRTQIAAAAGVHRNLLYQIIGTTKR